MGVRRDSATHLEVFKILFVYSARTRKKTEREFAASPFAALEIGKYLLSFEN